jgi:hypothetical protein
MTRLPLFLLPVTILLFSAAGSRAENKAELTLPIDLTQAAAGWDFDPAAVRSVEDEETRRPALQAITTKKSYTAQFTSKEPIGDFAILEADVRLPRDAAEGKSFLRDAAAIGVITSDAGQPIEREVTVGRGRFRDDESYSGGVNFTPETKPLSFKPRFTLDSVSLLMDESVRTVLERTAYPLESAHRRTYRLRFEVRPDGLRAYVNGRFIGDGPRPAGPLKARLRLVDAAMVLDVRVTNLPTPTAAFVPVPLDDLCNAGGFGQPDGLPAQRGRMGEINGVPFVISRGSKGEDHVDLESSVYLHRLGTMRDGDSRESVAWPEEIDRSRFMLRVPERTYRRVWVLAAADGEPTSTPVLTVRFFKPRTAWTVDAAATVPLFETTTSSVGAKRIPLKGGKKAAALWLLPIELDAAALAAEPMICLELTKEIHAYRSWPDPAYFNSYPGGLPSGVHVYGLTLEEAPLRVRATGAQVGNTYIGAEKPLWRVLIESRSSRPIQADIHLRVTDPYGKSAVYDRQVKLADRAEQEVRFEPAAEMFGLYTVETSVAAGDFRQSRTGTFLRVPPSTRRAVGGESPWGLWCWAGTHTTPDSLEGSARLLKAIGAVNSLPEKKGRDATDLAAFRREHGFGLDSYRLVGRQLPPWASQSSPNPADVAAYSEEKGKEALAELAINPDRKYVNFFAENAISLRVTHGLSPWSMGQPYFEYTPAEDEKVRAHWLTAKAAAEGVRKHAPGLKVIFGHGAGNFAQPFFRLDDWRNDLFDGFGMDLPQFERMPERQPRATEPSLLFFLHKQMLDKGLAGKEVVHLESYFPSSGPMGLTFDEQAASVVRTAVLSLSLGTTKFMKTWSLETCADGWGSSHYGCCGLYDRLPDFNPKLAAAAFATMTQALDLAKYDGWLETGSRSAFCVRFRDADRTVYAVWTIRGTRPLELTTSGNGKLTRYDLHGNAFPVEVSGGNATVTLSPNPQWIVGTGVSLVFATAGPPSYTEAPAPLSTKLDDFERSDWKYDAGADEAYQTNHWDMPREAGRMEFRRAKSADRDSTVLQVKLAEPDQKKPMVGFYGMFTPPAPIPIVGKADALGMYVRGRSAWNRIIYEVTDAKGEKWRSCGTRDAWNCDDIHSWNSINHDGWRYLRFPLPSTAPGDGYREPDTVWWGSDAEGIVDLPLKLTRIFVEMRPQMIYVDQMLPIDDLSIELDDLSAEYASRENMTSAPVKLQTSAADAMNKGALAALPNPYTELQQKGAGAVPKIAKVFPPPDFYDGTRLFVEIEPAPSAKGYRGYVAAYPDGRGAKALAVDQSSTNKWAKSITAPNILLFDKLVAARPMYVFVTAVDADGKESKPSAIREVILKDEFPFK